MDYFIPAQRIQAHLAIADRSSFFIRWLAALAMTGLLAFTALAGAHAAEAPAPEKFLRYALTKEGNASHGHDLFTADERLGCVRCHTIDGSAGKAGPDLFAVGEKFGRREIIEAVLNPSASIAVGYSSTTVQTKSGDDYTGIIKGASATELTLMGADAKLMVVPVSEIVERRTGEVSMMPEGLQQALTLEEFNDVIEFLVSLKQPAHSEINHQGMPENIAVTSQPVHLHPIHGPELKFEHPVCFEPVPGEPHVFLVAEHDSGKIWRLTCGDRASKTLFLDTGAHDPGARGLIGVIFHPQFATNRKYYVTKQVVHDGRFASVVVEREATADATADSGNPGRTILNVDGLTNVNHAGSLIFGTDGYLYIAMGDGGPPEDPQGHGQDLGVLLGKILRIDVDHTAPPLAYSIPQDNPFVGRAGFRSEIWAYGLREPWRCSFDPATGELWVADVGQDRYEEIDLVRAGENYGWNVYEGFEPFSNKYRRPDEKFARPVFGYRRKFGPCITGGYVYRAHRDSSFYGVYIFGDYESRRIFGLTQQDRALKEVLQIGTSPERIASFGQDETGELYIVGYEGTMFKLDFNGSAFH